MPVVSRAFRSVTRGRARTIGVAMIVGISLALFLILTQINTTVSSRVDDVRNALKDVVTVQKAGSGFSFTNYMNSSVASSVRDVAGVASVQRILLQIPGASGGGGPPSGGGPPKNFTLYEGIDTTSNVTLFGGLVGSTGLTITSGRTLNAADEDTSNVLVGSQFASNHNVGQGSSLDVNGTNVHVVGVFTTGSSFADSSVILPFPIAATAFAVPGPSLLYVLVSSSVSTNSVVSAISAKIGSSYDVTAAGEVGGGFGNALSSILSSTEFEATAALGVGGAVMVVTMALVTSRRTKEIGLLKAFGFTNGKIVRQLSLEGLILASFGLPIGLLATVWLGPTVAQLFAGQGSGPGGAPGGFVGGFLGTISFSLTPLDILLGVAVTAGFGLLGAMYPMLRALRLKPAEALRHE